MSARQHGDFSRRADRPIPPQPVPSGFPSSAALRSPSSMNPIASPLVHEQELERLEECANDGIYSAGVNTTTNLYSASIFRRWWHGESVLEMGCGDGNTTRIL